METDKNNQGNKTTDKLKSPDISKKLSKTFVLVVCWICLGLMAEIYGPTLIDLKARIKSNYDDVASALASKAIGTLIGSLMCGILIDKFGEFCELMVALSLDTIAAATIAIPWVPNTDLIWVLCCIQGVGVGALGASGMKIVFNIWLQKAASPMHILHCGYGIGSLLIPLIANPFLAVPISETDVDYENNTQSSSTETNTNTTGIKTLKSTNNEYLEPSRIEIAYLIPSLVSIGLSLVFYTYHLSGHKERKQAGTRLESINNTKSLKFKQMINPATCAGGNAVYGLQVFILLFLFYFNYTGGERIFGTFLRSFSIDHFGFTVDQGSYVNTSFWISYSVGRVVGMFAARWVTIRKLIVIETSGLLVSAILHVSISGRSAIAFWVVTQAMGFFSGPLYPTGMGWGNHHVAMTGSAISVCITGSCIGAFIYLKLIGYLYETYGPETYLYSLLCYSIAMFLISVLLDFVGVKYGKKENDDAIAEGKIEIEITNNDLT